jgi:hypothetical protein
LKQLAAPIIGLAVGGVFDLPPARATSVGIALPFRNDALKIALFHARAVAPDKA